MSVVANGTFDQTAERIRCNVCGRSRNSHVAIVVKATSSGYSEKNP